MFNTWKNDMGTTAASGEETGNQWGKCVWSSVTNMRQLGGPTVS